MFSRQDSLLTTRSLLALLVAGAVASRCSEEKMPDEVANPLITEFSATPASVRSGQTSVLKYTVTDAKSVKIDVQGGGSVLAETSVLFGMVTTAPLTASTTFILTASNGEKSSTRSVTVSVTADDNRAAISSFSANPSMVDPGQSSTLSWRTTNASEGVIRSGTTVLYTIPSGDITQGAFTVNNVMATTMYTLAVKGADGQEVTDGVTVTVNGPMVISFMASPNPITRGDSTTLSWNVRNATNIAITGSTSGEVYNGAMLMSSVNVSPAASETFTLVATDGRGGSDMDSVMVTVNQPQGAQIVSFMAAPTAVDLGVESILSWEVSNAPGGIEISANAQVLTTSMSAMGMFAVRPAATTTYTLRAINAAQGDAMATAQVRVNASVPGILSFTASPNPGRIGGTTRLAWSTIGGTSIRVLRGATQIFMSTTATEVDSGQLDADLTVTSTTFTLEASNVTGGNTSAVRVVAHDVPTINAFTVAPTAITMPETATVTWDVSNASSLELFANGVAVAGFPVVSTGTTAGDSTGSFSLNVTASTIFELVARSGGGQSRSIAIVSLVMDEVEPNDTATAAIALPGNGDGVDAEILPGGDLDWYTFTVPAGGNVIAETSDGQGSCAADTFIDLIGPDRTTVLVSDDDDGASLPGQFFGCSRIDWMRDAGARNLAAGTYYVRVRHFSATGTGSYAFTLLVGSSRCGNGVAETNATTPEQCDDGNAVSGDGCSATCGAEPVQVVQGPGVDRAFTGAIRNPGQVDVYRIDMQAAGYIRAETFAPSSPTCTAVNTIVRLYGGSFQELGSDDNDGVLSCSLIDPTVDGFASVTAGTYYLTVEEFGNDGTIPAYALSLRLIGVGCGNAILEAGEQCDDGNNVAGDGCTVSCTFEGQLEDEAGNNNTFNGAGVRVATMSTIFSGAITPVMDEDWYAVTVPNGYHVDAYVTVNSLDTCPAEPAARGRLALFDTDGSTQLAINSTGGPNANCGRISPNTTLAAFEMVAGTYYLRVDEVGANSTIATYYLHLSIVAPGCGNGFAEATEQCDDGNVLPGDGCTAACQIEPEGVFNAPSATSAGFVAAIDPVGDLDFYQVVVGGTSDVYLRAETFAPNAAAGTCSGGVDTIVTLYDNTLTEIGSDDDDGIGFCSLIRASDTFARLSPGTYFVSVEDFGNNGVISAYELVLSSSAVDVCGNGVTEAAEQCDDGNTAAADGCSAACSYEINPVVVNPPGGTVTVNFPTATSFAVVQVNITQPGQSVTATAADAGGATCDLINTAVTLGDATFTVLGSDTFSGPTGTAGTCGAIEFPLDTFATNLQMGTYYLAVTNENGVIGSAELRATILNASCGNRVIESNAGENCDDGNAVSGDGCSAVCTFEGTPPILEVEPNGSAVTAQSLGTLAVPGVVDVSGSITPISDEDFFSFVVPAGGANALITTYDMLGNLQACTFGTDTEIWLYNGIPTDLGATTSADEPTLVSYDDQDGPDPNCSQIDGTVTSPTRVTLPAGTYFLRVRYWLNFDTIPQYYARIDLQ